MPCFLFISFLLLRPLPPDERGMADGEAVESKAAAVLRA